MNIEEIKKNIEQELSETKDIKSLNDLKVKYLGKKGIITELASKIKEVPNEEKKEYGLKMNELKKTELIQVKVTKKQKGELIKRAEKKEQRLTEYIREKILKVSKT